MPDVITLPNHLWLASTFRQAARHLEKATPLSLLDVKFYLLSALNDIDRALDYGKPGDGLNEMLGKDRPINAEDVYVK